ncbi:MULTISPECIES: cyclic-phosphate processing receiver domain-containing protein [unclassified Bacillus (in: firmicutes)]|uniref:cyclic-phosphate processing receiver domain-containing protein n=1 Tax=unclassified Bacillus (in: firmicutes) TaxID=185979 RepID=UPI0008F253A2|nr:MULTISPECIES: cyclic-phosphate processing receiver domain-containing protein [unclassified Bacillus (in: firmicutes)]SFA86023.1 hypothetical protein SAMN02799634_10283 [Bacillus sp. UNCCL13]SFQ83568.1 hypothetical protein SAMN04488577_2202 [Bacillus sp. cl95]
MKKISVFLDDYRIAPDGYVLAETIDECLELLHKFEIEHLSLDHDLVDRYRNGFMLVQRMIRDKLFADRITIHSANAVGGKAMYKSLLQAQKDSLIPSTTIISLRPLPLDSIPISMIDHYLKTKILARS